MLLDLKAIKGISHRTERKLKEDGVRTITQLMQHYRYGKDATTYLNHIFESKTMQLEKGDWLYLFTDGFPDQFGSNGKKLMTRKFKEILLSIQDKSMEQQKEYLKLYIEKWKGDTEQTDDLLIIGIRV